MGFTKEFREFILKGSVVDLAVGVIIGAAFGGVVKSAVDDVMMPPLGYLMGGVDFADKSFKFTPPQIPGTTTPPKDIELKYGKFLNAIIALVIQGLAIFAVIKLMNTLRKPAPAVPAGPPSPTKDQELLTEIRDLLKRGAK